MFIDNAVTGGRCAGAVDAVTGTILIGAFCVYKVDSCEMGYTPWLKTALGWEMRCFSSNKCETSLPGSKSFGICGIF